MNYTKVKSRKRGGKLEMRRKKASTSQSAQSVAPKFTIHPKNIFRSIPKAINYMSCSPNNTRLAICRDFANSEWSKIHIKHPLSIVEIYLLSKEKQPKLLRSFVESEVIKGLDWLNDEKVITANMKGLLNVYDSRRGEKLSHCFTDYGPITCMKVERKFKLIITGTQSGFATVYNWEADSNLISAIDKMVKVNNPIICIDYLMKLNPKKTCRRVSRPKKPKKKRRTSPRKCVTPKEGKRKQPESDSEDSDDNEEDDAAEDIDLENAQGASLLKFYEMTIYGGCDEEVIVWNYHKRTVSEKIKVSDKKCPVWTVTALNNGDVIVGDKSGTLSVYETDSFTCKQHIKCLDSDILSLAKNQDETELICSGREPVLRKLSKQTNGDWLLTDKIRAHTHEVRSLVYLDNENIFSGGQDSVLVHSSMTSEFSAKALVKTFIRPDYSEMVDFCIDNEVMVKEELAVAVWKSEEEISRTMLPKPTHLSSKRFRTRQYALAAALNEDWVAFATIKNVYVYKRMKNSKPLLHKLDRKLAGCTHLRFCHKGKYLAVVKGKHIFLVDLTFVFTEGDDCDNLNSNEKEDESNEKNLTNGLHEGDDSEDKLDEDGDEVDDDFNEDDSDDDNDEGEDIIDDSEDEDSAQEDEENSEENAEEDPDKDLPVCNVVAELNCHRIISNIISLKDYLVVACRKADNQNVLCVIDIKNIEKNFQINSVYDFKDSIISFIGPGLSDSEVYAFTLNDHLVKLNLKKKQKKKRSRKNVIEVESDSKTKIVGLPYYDNIIGHVPISKDVALLYSRTRINRVNLNNGQVVEVVLSQLQNITKMHKCRDGKITLVEEVLGQPVKFGGLPPPIKTNKFEC